MKKTTSQNYWDFLYQDWCENFEVNKKDWLFAWRLKIAENSISWRRIHNQILYNCKISRNHSIELRRRRWRLYSDYVA